MKIGYLSRKNGSKSGKVETVLTVLLTTPQRDLATLKSESQNHTSFENALILLLPTNPLSKSSYTVVL